MRELGGGGGANEGKAVEFKERNEKRSIRLNTFMFERHCFREPTNVLGLMG